ncbi:MAG: hypothetical protein A2X40_12380 [Elusimicrobia bacterium GWC2_65_9]|nr:MAG: hypothetical protein A2X37_10865 [Elusimicrobia bacterium GWA2_66_18]OGR69520.1 MAG: hypothetical protein A2X40_12380 [Elusimicrobia bacterium GWC2_65_9]
MPTRALTVAVILSLCGCAGLPPREPTAVSHGMLSVRARVRGAVIPFSGDEADSAVVEQLGPNGEPLPGKEAVAGLSGGGFVYFLDLPPGRYALISVSFRARGVRYRVNIPPASGRKEAVDLRPGAAAFLGTLSLDGRLPDFEVAVERALSVLGHLLTPWMRRPVVARDADLRGLDRGAQEEARALHAARQVLGATQWKRVVEARRREMGAPEPVAMKGLVRPKQMTLKAEAILSWRDTLEWGEPQRAGNGLVWTKPGGSARIAVFFTTAAAQGFVGYEAAVAEMRAAASTTDVGDQGALYEVRVSTHYGVAARVTSTRYREGTLVGSEFKVAVTETVLVPYPAGMYTARLRAAKDEFDEVLPAFREFLLQLVLGAPQKTEAKQDDIFLPL